MSDSVVSPLGYVRRYVNLCSQQGSDSLDSKGRKFCRIYGCCCIHYPVSFEVYTMPQTTDQFQPGQKVTVTQQIAQRDEVWTTKVTGTVLRVGQAKTGSWFAHAKDDRLWLDRLVLKKDDGEIVVINLDPYTHVELLDTAGDSTPAKA